MTRRMDRVNVLLRQEISRLIAVELNDPRMAAMVSITRVEASVDLRHARVYVSVLGNQSDKDNTLKALRSAAGFLHQSLKGRLSMKAVPHLDFYLDESIERGAEVLDLIRQANRPAASGEGA